MAKLGPDSAKIFRITHKKNVPWILQNGLHCQNSATKDPEFVPIGMKELIEKRETREVPIPPGGFLSNYVPFYFTPWSVMLYKIHTGHEEIERRDNEDIVIIVSSLHTLAKNKVPFVFTNQHAYSVDAEYYGTLDALENIDWDLLRRRDFKRDPWNDPGKINRYNAEALVHEHVPIESVEGIACYDDESCQEIVALVKQKSLVTPVKSIPGWYFK